MELDQVVFEYGKLQLNFVACQRQNATLAQQLAAMNKQVFHLTKERQTAVARVSQLEKAWPTSIDPLPEVPTDPEPAKDAAAGDALNQKEAKPDDSPATGIQAAAQTSAGKIRAVPDQKKPSTDK
jgi:hypothetical protein